MECRRLPPVRLPPQPRGHVPLLALRPAPGRRLAQRVEPGTQHVTVGEQRRTGVPRRRAASWSSSTRSASCAVTSAARDELAAERDAWSATGCGRAGTPRRASRGRGPSRPRTRAPSDHLPVRAAAPHGRPRRPPARCAPAGSRARRRPPAAPGGAATACWTTRTSTSNDPSSRLRTASTGVVSATHRARLVRCSVTSSPSAPGENTSAPAPDLVVLGVGVEHLGGQHAVHPEERARRPPAGTTRAGRSARRR